MTTIAAPGAAARTRRVPLRRVAWVSWRQHRATLAGAVALFAVLGGYLLYMGLEIHHAYAAVAACHPASSATCGQSAALYNFNQNYYGTQQGSVVSSGIDAQTVPFLLLAVPILLGVFMLAERAALAADSDFPQYPGAYPAGYPAANTPGAAAAPSAATPPAQTSTSIVPAPTFDLGQRTDGEQS